MGCSPPSPPPGLTQQGDTEQRQEHEGARGGPSRKENGQEPQEPPQEQPVQPGASPAAERDAGAGGELGGPTPPPPRHAPARPGPFSPPAGAPRAAAGARHRRPPNRTRRARPALTGTPLEYSSPLLARHQPRPGPAASAAASACGVTIEIRPPAPPLPRRPAERPLATAALTGGTAPPAGAVRVCAVPHGRAGPGPVDVLASLSSSRPLLTDTDRGAGQGPGPSHRPGEPEH